MKTLAILSRKGGAGKTTLTVHLAVAADQTGAAVAVFDLDPQASAAVWGDRRDGQTPAIVAAQAPRLPALLAQARAQEAELIILDTAPHADSIAAEAAAHADAVLIPCRPSAFDLDAIGASVKLAQAAGKPVYVIINAAPPIGPEADEMRAALGAAGVLVCPVVIHQRKAFATFIQEGKTAIEGEPKSKAAKEIRDLLRWACEQVNFLPSEQGKKLSAMRKAR
ncbi:MAG TPA: AAA family ATPase [Stellaceae bacterium]|nr:AAA family ATPase [Stellaceae bacterium]